MLFITSSSESSQICNEIVKFLASKAINIFKIFFLWWNFDISLRKEIEFCIFQSFDKNIANNRKDDLILIKAIQ